MHAQVRGLGLINHGISDPSAKDWIRLLYVTNEPDRKSGKLPEYSTCSHTENKKKYTHPFFFDSDIVISSGETWNCGSNLVTIR